MSEESAREKRSIATPDSWSDWRRWTSARIALGRAGASLPTRALLDFQLAHAGARDAVHAPFHPGRIKEQLAPIARPMILLQSAARDRAEYLQRPDLGRRLDADSRAELERWRSTETPDVAIVISDGLSALAAHRQFADVVLDLVPRLEAAGRQLAPIVIVSLGRVAVADEIGELLGARLTVIFLGERPGLGAPDSLGAYLTFGPRVGRTDAERNCVSNIRPEGLAPPSAAAKVAYLIDESLRRGLSGVALKDEFPTGSLGLGEPPAPAIEQGRS